MPTLKQLIQQRKVWTSRITEIYTLAVKAKDDANEVDLLVAKYESIDEFYAEFKQLHNEIVGLIADDEFDAQDAIRRDTDEFYFKIKEIYNRLFPVNRSNNTVVPTQDDKIKLPKITVPIFDGNMLKWPTFYDMFSSVVHNNSSLANIQKFQYLISFLQGEPLNLIKSLQTTDANYTIAFQTLVSRYQNKRILATSYWNTIVNVTPMKPNCSKDLRNILDIFSENLSALKILQFPVDSWSFVLFNLLLQKIDNSTRTAFEMKHTDKEIPTYKELKDFLEKQCKALESVEYMPSQSNISSGGRTVKQSGLGFGGSRSNRPVSTTLLSNNITQPNFKLNSNSFVTQKCKLCNNNPHPLSQCPRFISKTPHDRFSYVKQINACLNCLRYNHLLKDCPSNFNCRLCHYRHHTMIHLPQNTNSVRSNQPASNPVSGINSSHYSSSQSGTVAEVTPSSSNNPRASKANSFCQPSSVDTLQQNGGKSDPSENYCTSLTTTSNMTVLLSTAEVEILDSRENYQKIRVVLDSASQANFISENCLKRLGLPRKKYSIPISGLNHSSSSTNGIARCTIRPKGLSVPIFSLDVLVLPKLCAHMPSIPIDSSAWSHISNLKLGDEAFSTPAPVDMLLGAEIYADILKSGRIQGQPGQPTALETVFGWVLLGKVQDTPLLTPPLISHFTCLEVSLDSHIRKFWEIESLPIKSCLSPDDQKCEQIYQDTYFREKSGRFVVSLPFKNENPDLGDTFTLAYRCFISLEGRLLRNSVMYSLYSEFMKKYLENGHMSLISNHDITLKNPCYLPHHGVFKTDNTSSKIRVVFNASARGSKGISLNDTLHSGPKLQTDISVILVKFRLHKVVFLADIKQMYLQILLHPDQRDYQRILWRFSPNEPLQEYRLNTVTFGITSSPYLAIRTLRELATIEAENYPEASAVILENTFMDDICAGSSDIKSALRLQQNLIALLKSGGFELSKWASNRPELLHNIPQSDSQISFDNSDSPIIKVLGLQYQPSADNFSYSCSPSQKPFTKRNILSEIARIFDPLGFLSPVSFLAKYIMQRLWISGVGWDETPPPPIMELWSQFQIELPLLSQISLPRYILSECFQRCQLLGFADASDRGYACAVYLRIELPDDTIKSSLVIGKSRVAPLKTVSVPRLELLGAALLADLLKFVLDNISSVVTIDEVMAFTDSQVVLAWLSDSPHRWKSFVANRVSHIQQLLPEVSWYHVCSSENPVDCASRGLTAKQLISHPLWFHGPPWFTCPRSEWKLTGALSFDKCDTNEEQKSIVLTTTVEYNFLEDLLVRHSSIQKIQRIICLVLRFLRKCKINSPEFSPVFTPQELNEALGLLIKQVQVSCFPDIVSRIRHNLSLPKPFRKLAVFLDNGGLLRVGGRLRHSELSWDAKHPLLLPRCHRLTHLIIEDVHKRNLHPGFNTLQYLLRQKFWIMSSRRAIEKILSHCIRCFKAKPKFYAPYMGDLPSFRISQLKCFSHVALDYAGPIQLKMSKTRGSKLLKGYICIFVCCSTKAIHLELVSDLTSDAFIAALRRFVARRGRCTNLYSDCGTNFIGASAQLEQLAKYASEQLQLVWHFNPPGAPHFNGLAEAGVKSVKTHLVRVIGEQVLTYEELQTLLTQIEALLNSRPLCSQSSDPNDLSSITPGHFLTLEPLNSCPDPDLSHLKLNTLSRWQLVQKMHSDFWKRWKEEYLTSLQVRSKWYDSTSNIKLNTLVLLKSEAKHPLHWPLGRIVALHPGMDGHTRVVTVKTATGLFKRPIVKLCPLPGQD